MSNTDLTGRTAQLMGIGTLVFVLIQFFGIESLPSGHLPTIPPSSDYQTSSPSALSGLFTTDPGTICPTLQANEIGGTVWEDWNYDGTMNEGDTIGVGGVEVRLYDCNDILVSTQQTDTIGHYKFTGLTGPATGHTGERYRVEFTLPAHIALWAKPTRKGTDAGTSVQFSAPGDCINLGIAAPQDYCQVDPRIGMVCFENGTAAGNNNPGLVSFSYSASGLPAAYTDGDGNAGSAQNPLEETTIAEIGAVHGTAWQASHQRMYMAALTKRFVGLKDGTGYIYLVDFSSGSASAPVGLNLSGITPVNSSIPIETGTICRDAACANDPGNTGFASDYELPNDPTQQSIDLDAFGKVGRTAFGDADISEDGTTLYLVNLFQRSLITIDVSGPTASLPGDIRHYFLDDLSGVPACTNGTFRPWAVAFEKGRGYLGGICDATGSRDSSDLHAYVLSFDPAAPENGFTTEVDFPLDYNRENGQRGSQTSQLFWQPWAFTWNQLDTMTNGGDNNLMAPQPILADIEFNERGDMIIGMMDRFGHQNGRANKIAVSQTTQAFDTNAGGDLLHLCRTATGWALEGAAGCPVNDDNFVGDPNTTLLQNDGLTGNGEFYYEDYFTEDTSSNALYTHAETATGSLFLKKGTRQVMSTHYDPLWGPPYIVNSQGVVFHNTYHGAREDSYQVVASSGGTPETFAKANGLGDMEGMCDAAPIEIGNYVWFDENGNGIQEPCEPGLENVIVALCDTLCGEVAFDTTNVNGEYYFNEHNVPGGLLEHERYLVVFGAMDQFDPATGTLGNTSLVLSTRDAGNNDETDSDARINESGSGTGICTNERPFIEVTTGRYGCVDHSLDVGFTDCTVSASEITGDQTVCSGDDPAAFTVTTAASGSGTLSFQWQSSTTDCASGFSDISGATSETFNPPALDTTTYFRSIVSNSVACRDTSNCLTVSVRKLNILSATPGSCDPATNIYSLSVVLNYTEHTGSDLKFLIADDTFTVTPDGSGHETFQLHDLSARTVGAQNVIANYTHGPACADTLQNAFTPPAGCRGNLETEDPCVPANGVVIDLLGTPITDDSQYCLNLTTEGIDPAETDSLLLWVFSRNNKPASVTFTSDNGLNVTLNQNQGVAAGGSGFYYRTKVAADGSTNYCAQTAGNNQNNERSFGSFVFQSPPAGTGAVSSTFVGEYLFWNGSMATNPGVEDCLILTETVAAGDQAQRDIVLQIAVDDLEDNDPRTIDFEFTAGSINDSYTRSGPTFDLGSLGIYEFTLQNVPQSVTDIQIEVCSKQANNGQSLFFTGVVADGEAGCLPCQLTVTTNDPEICAGETATITATPVDGDGSYFYDWTVPASETDPGDTNSFSTMTSGDYIVTVTDGAGCSATDTSTVVINPNPTVSVNDPTVCEGETKTIMATVLSGPSPYSYAWSVPMGVSDPGDVTSFSAGTAGAYTVTLTDGNGCTATGTGNLTVLPNATGEENYTGCEGDGYTVQVNGTTYNEMNPMGTETLTAANGCDSVATVNLIFQPNATGEENYTGCEGDGYTVQVNGTTYNEMNPMGTETLTAANNCDSVVTVNLIFREGPTVSVDDQTGICEGDPATITATVSGGGGSNSYQWNVPTGATDPGDVMSFQTTEPGIYTVTVTDANGCTGSNSGEVSVVSLTASINAVACDDNDTPAISTDDFFTFTLIVNENGATSTGYQVLLNAQPDGSGGTVIATGTYGTTLMLGQNEQFAADGSSSYDLTIRESGGGGCFLQNTVGPVDPCSNCPTPNCGTIQIQQNSRDGM